MLLHSYQKEKLEAGCDEAGRGPLAGPVVGAAVILPSTFRHPLLNDSKQLNEKQRLELKDIIEKEAISYAVSAVDHNMIDKINILQATFLAIHQALTMLKPQPKFISMDGNRFKPYKAIEHKTIVKGDSKYMNIAAASILAKTARDEIMVKLDKEYPMYGWANNKGYPTKAHREAIAIHGACAYHRHSFQLLPKE